MNNETRGYIIIEPFMIDYKLPQTELFCFAIIHSFSKQQQGCFYGTQGYLAEQIKTSRQAVNKALLRLEETGLITKTASLKRFEYATTVDKKGATTVAHPATTVDKGATVVDKGATTVAHILNNNKENIKLLNKKESKKEKTQATAFDCLIFEYTKNSDLRTALIEFIKMRVMKKRPPTSWALQLIFKKLDKLAKTDEGKIEILNCSTVNGWQDVYEPKANKGQSMSQQDEEFIMRGVTRL